MPLGEECGQRMLTADPLGDHRRHPRILGQQFPDL